MTLNELREKHDKLEKELDEILARSEPTDEDLSRAESIQQAELPELARREKILAANEERKAAAAQAAEEQRILDNTSTGVEAGRADTADEDIEIREVRDCESAASFRSFGEQLKAVADAARIQAGLLSGPIDKRLLKRNEEYRAASGANEAILSEGGFLVQKDFAQEIFTQAYETGQVAQRCKRIPVGPNSNGLKMNAIDQTSRANGSRWGGVQVYWASEADTVTAKKPKFRQMEWNLNKLFGLFYATEEILADATALGAIATQAFTEEISYTLDDTIINGLGSGQPVGILRADCTVSVAKESGQSATTYVFENAVKQRARLWARSRPNAVWLYNQDVDPQLLTMSLAVGTGGSAVYMPAGGASAKPYDTLLGMPMIPIEQAATLGTVGDVILADLSQYLIVDKGGVQSDSSMHVRFINDETTYRFIYRVDGQPLWNSALTPAKGSNTQSPFVTVATR